jgi:hypothetical protein
LVITPTRRPPIRSSPSMVRILVKSSNWFRVSVTMAPALLSMARATS